MSDKDELEKHIEPAMEITVPPKVEKRARKFPFLCFII
jgi:hypothetical protein